MTTALARDGIIVIGLISVASFWPGIVRWYHHHHDRTLVYDHRFRVQHLSHLILLIHHSLVVLMMLSINPFFLLPGTDLHGPLGRWYTLSVIAGLALFALGNGLRIWAAYYLGVSFDKSVLIRADHRLSTGGPYRLARHPIYVGNLVAEIGLGLSLVSWPLLIYTLVLSVPVWNYRAGIEETLLAEHFGQAYRDYRKRVGRWWP